MHPKLEEFWQKSGPRFTELLCVGGERPQSYGYISGSSEHPYGRRGLEQDEFFEHVEINAFLNGMLAILGKEEAVEFGERVRLELERVIQKNKDEVRVGEA